MTRRPARISLCSCQFLTHHLRKILLGSTDPYKSTAMMADDAFPAPLPSSGMFIVDHPLALGRLGVAWFVSVLGLVGYSQVRQRNAGNGERQMSSGGQPRGVTGRNETMVSRKATFPARSMCSALAGTVPPFPGDAALTTKALCALSRRAHISRCRATAGTHSCSLRQGLCATCAPRAGSGKSMSHLIPNFRNPLPLAVYGCTYVNVRLQASGH